MKYIVRFYRSQFNHVISIQGDTIGYSEVNRIRNELNDPNLPLSKIKDQIDGISQDVEIEVDEEKAQKVEQFKHDNYIEVQVPEATLNDYVYSEVSVMRCPNTKEIASASIIYKINREQILKDWINDGAPLNFVYIADKELTSIAPDFYYVLVDETDSFREDIQERAGKIFGVYLVDKNKHVHPCSTMPHFELYFIQNFVSVNGHENFSEEELMEIEHDNSDEEVKYIPVYHPFPAENKQDRIDEEELKGTDVENEEYAEAIDQLIENYKANPVF